MTHLYEESFDNFQYPYDGDIRNQCFLLRHGNKPEVDPINNQTFSYRHNNERKCKDEFGQSPLNPHLVIIVKSKLDNFEKRNAIRNSWGFERRFSDVLIKTVFSLGIDRETHDGLPSETQKLVDLEAEKYQDIIQFNFIDEYFNNTLKTINGIRWCKENCIRSKFFFFVDDDFYVSVKNILAFLRYPTYYPEYLEEHKEDLRKINQRKIHGINQNETVKVETRNLLYLNMELPPDVKLFAGFVFDTTPHRHKSSKWFVSLKEYKYDKWPTYVTAGAFLLSREALQEIYCYSLYTKLFRFDDVFLGIVAHKAGIEPIHSEEFHFYQHTYTGPASYRYVLAAHGYDDPKEMTRVWSEVRANGFA
ncbi:CLUMA_CG012165, isoform A [Clunio marinus]|uniref:Hexosyltransferase n=1 Tax=Clunio marinus TaxID=568069 RepID=A0A1J1IEH7_9DIPT|nr:CLUMA_CG012165, isoform A [Clunio marinus]